MIFQCGDLERALRSPELMPDARAHAEQCEQCRTQLELWDEISRVAPELHEEWESRDLWPRIEASLTAEPARSRTRFTPFIRWTLAVAATVTLGVVLMPGRHTAPVSHELLTDSALSQVRQAEAAYATSIANLAAVAGPQLQRSASPLSAAYREKLTMLDSAIAALKTTAAHNPYNAYLRAELASLYGEKKRTLEEWIEDAKRN